MDHKKSHYKQTPELPSFKTEEASITNGQSTASIREYKNGRGTRVNHLETTLHIHGTPKTTQGSNWTEYHIGNHRIILFFHKD